MKLFGNSRHKSTTSRAPRQTYVPEEPLADNWDLTEFDIPQDPTAGAEEPKRSPVASGRRNMDDFADNEAEQEEDYEQQYMSGTMKGILLVLVSLLILGLVIYAVAANLNGGLLL